MHQQKTNLLMKKIGKGSLPNASAKFNEKRNENDVNLVLFLDDSSVSCFYTVPAGVNSIMQRFGKDIGSKKSFAQPGLQQCQFCTGIKYIVTQQTIPYNAPVKQCPTMDNVMVNCELTVMFRIGNGELAGALLEENVRMVKDFIYKLGVVRFNELLAVAVEEMTRQLIRKYRAKDVLELRGSKGGPVKKIQDNLDVKFRHFGVQILETVVTNVNLERDLMNKMEQTQKFDTDIEVVNRQHETAMQQIGLERDQRLKDIKKDFDRKLQEVAADKEIAKTTEKEWIIQHQTQAEKKIIEAKQGAETMITRAMAKKETAKSDAQQEVEALIGEVESRTTAAKIRAESAANVRVKESEALVEVAKKTADALMTEAQAEADSAAGLKSVREWELEMAKCEVVEVMAKRNKIVIGGAVGKRIVDSFCSPGIFSEKGIELKMKEKPASG